MFLFLKYIKPVWYYRLACSSPSPLLLDVDLLTGLECDLVIRDSGYTDLASIRMDAAYQGLITGLIPDMANCLRQTDTNEVSTVTDNYHFIRKYFATHWYVYVLFIRLITLNNPFKEFWYFMKNLPVKRFKLHSNQPKLQSINTILVEIPFVSIVIPTLNRYEYLRDVLIDLENQTYKHFEVLICDQSDLFDDDFYSQWKLNLTVIKQSEKALWLARNKCILQSKGAYIALTEDDVRLGPHWLEMHLYCIKKYDADASCGIFFPAEEEPAANQTLFKLSEQFAAGNTLIRKSVFTQVGLFDRQFEGQRMGDGEFGLRCILAGFKLIQNPLAYCIDVKAPTGGLRLMGSWDALRPKNFFAPRPVPSVIYFIRNYFGNESAIYYILSNVPSSFIPYKWRKKKVLKLILILFVPFILPVMILAVAKSWGKANRKLFEGQMIQYL